MRRAEVNVEVCHVVERGKSTKKQKPKGKKQSKKSPAKRKRPKPIESDWETAVSEWEDEDELNESQYLQGDLGLTLVRKRSAEQMLLGTKLGNEPVAKRLRTGVHEVD